MKYCYLFVALMLLPNIAESAFIAGNELFSYMENCAKFDQGDKTPINHYGCGVSTGYILGVVDLNKDLQKIIMGTEYRDTFKFTCLPNVSSQQLFDVVHKWLKDHPALRHNRANSLVEDALLDAWPCPE